VIVFLLLSGHLECEQDVVSCQRQSLKGWEAVCTPSVAVREFEGPKLQGKLQGPGLQRCMGKRITLIY
jgi:hypothetical protein